MTRSIVCIVLTCLIMAGCGNRNDAALKTFLPGTYTTSYEGDYSIGNDTLEIRQQGNGENNAYTIIKRNAHQRKQNGVLKEGVNYKSTTWTGLFDESTKALTITRTGRVLLFDVEQNEMKMGITTYKKLKTP